MDTTQFDKDVETLYYALQADSRLKDVPIQAGKAQPTSGEKSAYVIVVGGQRFIVALYFNGQPYWTNRVL